MLKFSSWFRKPEPEIPLDIREMHFKDGRLDVSLESADMVHWFANAVLSFWKDNKNPPNYVSVHAWVPELNGMFEMIVQRLGAESPATQNERLRREIAELQERITQLEAPKPKKAKKHSGGPA